MEKFREIGLSEQTIRALSAKGFEEPTEIQARTIPLLLEGQSNVIAQAQTGTGKTAAFGLVFMERLAEAASHVQAIVLTPTRELALQVADEIASLRGDKRLRVAAVYGGQSISLQLRQLKQGVDIVIGTPGRVMDHLKRGTLDISKVAYTVLDEADEMLNMGFIEDIEEILEYANPQRQLLLFSATMPQRILGLAKKYMPKHTLIKAEKKQLDKQLIEQIWFEVREGDKFEALCRIIDVEEEFYGIVFCRTKIIVDDVASRLTARGYEAEALHGDIAQHQRERILTKFRDRHTTVLVATDVAARGIDVSSLTHVINYSIPQDPENYVHRIGRTGRAGNQGTAITFVTPNEYRDLAFIKRISQSEIRKERVPRVEEILTIRKRRLIREVHRLIDEGGMEDFTALAEELMAERDAKSVIAALAAHAFSDELSAQRYGEIREFTDRDGTSVDASGRTRLFVAVGKRDGATPRGLVDFFQQEAGVPGKAIHDVAIFDNYSFITASFAEAERILSKFKGQKNGLGVVVKKATARTGGGGDFRGGDSRGGKPPYKGGPRRR